LIFVERQRPVNTGILLRRRNSKRWFGVLSQAYLIQPACSVCEPGVPRRCLKEIAAHCRPGM